jgi:hypothetical protein
MQRFKKLENSLSSQKFNWKTHCFLESYDTVKSEVPEFGKVLDLNRLSLALLCKQNGCEKQFRTFKGKNTLEKPQPTAAAATSPSQSSLVNTSKIKSFF